MCDACDKPRSALTPANHSPEALTPCPEAMRELFSRHGIRCTTQRAEVYAALCDLEEHPTAEELLEAVRKTSPGISLATIYNTLEILTKSALVRMLASPTPGGPCRYDAELRDHVHLHTPDGQVRDLPDELGKLVYDHLPKHIIERIEADLGVKIDRVAVDLIARPA